MTDNGSFFPPLVFNRSLCTTSLLCSPQDLLYFMYVVPSQLIRLHICHYHFDMSTVDPFEFFSWRQAKQSMWGKVE